MNKEYWINDNGVDRKLTQEELAEYERMQTELPPSPPSLEDEVAQLKKDNAELREELMATKILLGVEE